MNNDNVYNFKEQDLDIHKDYFFARPDLLYKNGI